MNGICELRIAGNCAGAAYLLCGVAALALTSCTLMSNKEKSKLKEFWRQQEDAACAVPNRTKFDLQRSGNIEYKVCEKRFTNEPNSQFTVHYDIFFPNVTQENYSKLAKAYGDARGYDPSRKRYSLTEFLPPSIEVLNGMSFRIQRPSVPPEVEFGLRSLHPKGAWTEVFVQTNCWSTVYSILSARNSRYPMFFAESEQLKGVFDNPAYFDRLPIPSEAVSSFDENRQIEQAKQLLPMDVLLITVAGTIKHAALYVDKNLYFEKTGTGGNFAYRLIPFSVIQEMYPESDQKIAFYRLKQGAVLPHPSALFSLTAQFGNHFGKHGSEISAFRYPLAGKNINGFLYLSRIKDLDFNDFRPPDGSALKQETYIFR